VLKLEKRMVNVHYIVKIDGEVQIKNFEVGDTTVEGLTSEMLLSKDEIVNDIIVNRLSEDDKIYFKNLSQDSLSMEHMGMGMWIRNSYGLWLTDINVLVDEEASHDSEWHPDNLSFRIMELVKQTLSGEYDPKIESQTETKDFHNAMDMVSKEGA